MSFSKTILILVWWCILTINTNAQEHLVFEQVNDARNSLNMVRDIEEDHEGTMWFGMLGYGVCRYNGNSFSFNEAEINTTSTAGFSLVLTINRGVDGNLWIGTLTGLYKFNQINSTSFYAPLKSLHDQPVTIGVNDVLQPSPDSAWIASNGLTLLVLKGDTIFSKKNYTLESTDQTVISLMSDSRDQLWVLTSSALYKYLPEEDDFRKYAFPDNMYAHKGIIDHNGLFWIGFYGQGLWTFHPDTGFKDYLASARVEGEYNEFLWYINDMTQDHLGRIWVCTDGSGLGLIEPGSQGIRIFRHDSFDPYSLPHDNVQSITEDSRNFIWVGTAQGVGKLTPGNQHILRKFAHPEKPSLPVDWTTVLYEDAQGRQWIGTDGGGISIYDPSTGTYSHLEHDLQNTNSLSNNKVRWISEDKKGQIWIGHWEGGITRYDREKRLFERFREEDSPFLHGNQVRKVLQDEAGNDLVMSEEGLEFFNASINQWSHYPFKMGYDMVFDTKGTLWIAGMNGLGYLDKAADSIVRVLPNEIVRIHIDKKGIFWLSGFIDGILQYDPQKDTVYAFEGRGSPIGFQVHGIEPDHQGYLWVGGAEGIFRISPGDSTVSKLGQFPGSRNTSFRPLPITRDGNIHFAGTNGLVSFNPERIEMHQTVPAPILESFYLFGRKEWPSEDAVLRKSLSATSDIILAHEQNVFSVSFASLNYSSPDEVSYAYKLEGFDENWIDSKSQLATYTNLDPGDYNLLIRAKGMNGEWSEVNDQLTLHILPPFYMTNTAFVIYGAILVVILLLFRRHIIMRERFKSEIKLEQHEVARMKEVNKFKTDFFTNVSHEFRTPLTLIMGPLNKLLENKKYEEKLVNMALKNSQHLLQLINQILQINRDTSGSSLVTSRHDLVIFIRHICSSFETIAEQRKINFRHSSTLHKLEAYFDQQKLEEILFNLLSNAFKFTPEGGTVSLGMSVAERESDQERAYVVFRVKDTGIGIKSGQLSNIFERFYQEKQPSANSLTGNGIGLAITKEYVNLMNGEIQVKSTPGKGSEFIVTIPLDLVPMSKEEKWLSADAVIEKMITGKHNHAFTILVVDDNADMRSYLQHVLEEYRVIEAANATEAWASVKQETPDLIICDVMMAGMDGYKLTEKLKNDRHTSHIPVILLTARATQADKLKGLSTGANDYLTKPFSSQELLIRVQNYYEETKKPVLSPAAEAEWNAENIVLSEEPFIRKVLCVVEKFRSDGSFNTEILARELGMSRSQLFRKLKNVANLNPTDFIKTYRLQYGKTLIENNFGNISQVAFECGFNSPSYFTECFKKEFGYSPSTLQKEQMDES